MRREITTLLVDDEKGCLDILRHYLTQDCPSINIVSTAQTTEEAITVLRSRQIDLAFLDVHLLNKSIFDIPDIGLIKMKKVFVTAYEQYALQALRISALDYLLKPLERSEVIRCYQKILESFEGSAPTANLHSSMFANDKHVNITLRQGDNIYVIRPDDITLLKANGIYTNVFFEHGNEIKSVLICKPINTVCRQWNLPGLLRIHRSYAVNVKKVKTIKKQGTSLCIETAGNGFIPVAKRRTTYFLEQYKN